MFAEEFSVAAQAVHQMTRFGESVALPWKAHEADVFSKVLERTIKLDRLFLGDAGVAGPVHEQHGASDITGVGDWRMLSVVLCLGPR